MNFKKGDYFISLVNNPKNPLSNDYCRKFGNTYKVIGIDNDGWVEYITEDGDIGTITKDRVNTMEKVPIDNALNRKLYPNRIEWEGLLFPPNFHPKRKRG